MSSSLLSLRSRPAPTPDPAEDADLWSVSRVAKFLGMSASWVYRSAEAGTLPYVKIANRLRFVPREVVEWAMRQRGETAA